MATFDTVQSSHGAILLGVFAGIASTSVQSLGLTLQRKSHLLEDERPTQRPPYRRRRWQVGMGLFITSNIIGSSVQIGTLPLIILSPLQASGLVFNSICASIILGEPFTPSSLTGTVLVCIGAALIAVFGAVEEPVHNLDELLALFQRQQFILWLIGQSFIICGLLSFAHLIGTSRQSNSWKTIRGVAYGTVSGILSAVSLLLAKSAVELLIRTIINGNNQFTRWQSWAILLGLVSAALSQLYFLHRGLKLCSTSVLYPLVFCVYNIFAILDGIIYYNQANRLSSLSAWLIAIGVTILLSGVLALSWRLGSSSTPNIGDDPSPQTSRNSENTDIQNTTSVSTIPAPPRAPHPWFRSLYVGSMNRRASGQTHSSTLRYGSIARHRTLMETREILTELESDTPIGGSPPDIEVGAGTASEADEQTSLLPRSIG